MVQVRKLEREPRTMSRLPLFLFHLNLDFIIHWTKVLDFAIRTCLVTWFLWTWTHVHLWNLYAHCTRFLTARNCQVLNNYTPSIVYNFSKRCTATKSFTMPHVAIFWGECWFSLSRIQPSMLLKFKVAEAVHMWVPDLESKFSFLAEPEVMKSTQSYSSGCASRTAQNRNIRTQQPPKHLVNCGVNKFCKTLRGKKCRLLCILYLSPFNWDVWSS